MDLTETLSQVQIAPVLKQNGASETDFNTLETRVATAKKMHAYRAVRSWPRAYRNETNRTQPIANVVPVVHAALVALIVETTQQSSQFLLWAQRHKSRYKGRIQPEIKQRVGKCQIR